MGDIYMACIILGVSIAAMIYFIECTTIAIARRERRFLDTAVKITEALTTLDGSVINLRKVIGQGGM